MPFRHAPLYNRVPVSHLSAGTQRSIDMSQVAPLRQENPALGLIKALDFAGEPVSGKAPVQLDPIHHLMGQSMLLAGAERPGEHRTVSRTAIDAAGDIEQPFTREP